MKLLSTHCFTQIKYRAVSQRQRKGLNGTNACVMAMYHMYGGPNPRTAEKNSAEQNKRMLFSISFEISGSSRRVHRTTAAMNVIRFFKPCSTAPTHGGDKGGVQGYAACDSSA